MADMNKLLGQLLGSGAAGGFAAVLPAVLPADRLTPPTNVTAPARTVPCPRLLKRSSFRLLKARPLCQPKTIRRNRKHWA